MKTDAEKTEARDLRADSERAKSKQSHLHQAFDVGRLDNEVEPPKMLLDIVHAGVGLWGLVLAAGVFFFGGGDWRESLLVLGVFVFFIGAWRIAMIFGARRKKRLASRAGEADSPSTPSLDRSSPSGRKRDADPAPVDPTAETRPVDRSAESTAADREYVARSS